LEGNVEQPARVYEVPLWAILPPRAEASNLLVVATPSGSHVGFSSLRMEPQFMVLGHSAGTIAAIYADNKTEHAVIQDVDASFMAAALASEGQILRAPQCTGSVPAADLAWSCELGRCVGGSASNGTMFNSSVCDARCSELKEDEWLANAGFWSKSGASAIAAKSATWLKKSTVDSVLLPVGEKKHVPKGTRCDLVSQQKFEGYYLAKLSSPVVGPHRLKHDDDRSSPIGHKTNL
jgi:hypothetical protein